MRPWNALKNIAVLLGTLFVGTVLIADDGFLKRRGMERYLYGKLGYDHETRKRELLTRLQQQCPGVEFLPSTAYSPVDARTILQAQGGLSAGRPKRPADGPIAGWARRNG